ncbi:AI-2E family transporter [uncultured Clostridium sp.]|uniref:AI-2E family transporter n=1 Tax=uncultured Clostridium sp. TaxID=59620 RepID=UPI0025F228B4|nr:AI-2E family transporter [uncultured Clostridium sp.]
MNAQMYKSKILLITVIIICISVVLLYVFSSSIREIVDIVFISFALSYVLNPSKEFFMRKLKINGKAASVIVILIVAGIIFGGAAVILPSFVEELSSAGDIFDNVADFYKDIAEKFNLNDIPVLDSLYNSIMEKGSSLWLKFSADLLDNILKISSKIVSLAVMPVMIYYFMCDSDRIFSRMMLVFPTDKREVINKIVFDINKVLKRYISSQLYLCGIIGILTFILLIALSVKFPLWIALLNALFNIIPYFGPVFGILPAVLIALMMSPGKALWVLIGMIIIQQIEGNILSPKITGDSTEIHPFVIIILLLIGDKFGGFIGMILVVPMAVVIKVLYDDINYYLF